MANEELMHYGVPGMKWGVRKSPQSSGGSKLKSTKSKYDEWREKRKASKEAKEASKPKKRKLSELSDEELARRIRRAQMEDQYKQLRPEQATKGEGFTKTTFNKVIKPAAISSGERFLKNALDKYGDNVLNKMFPEGDKPLSWDDKLKKQSYDKNEKNKILEDLKRDFDIDKTRAEYDKWKNEQSGSNTRKRYSVKRNKSDDSDDGIGTMTVFGAGTSKRSDKTKRNIYDVDSWVDDVDITTSSSTAQNYSRIGQTYIAGLLEAPKDR